MSLRFVLIGHPVGHSLSPVIHRAAYEEFGLDHRYELMDVENEAGVKAVVDELRSGRIAGLNATIPHKRAILALADEATDAARRIGAANVLERRADGRVVAHNTDVLALVEEFGRHLDSLRRAVVIGAGGAALAAVEACRQSGASEIGVTARRWTAGTPQSDWPSASEFAALGARPLAWPESSSEAGERWHDFVRAADLVVQASSAGMRGADPGDAVAALVPFTELRRGALAYDLVYTPPDTPFVTRAARAGLRAEHGLSMLIGQAALAIRIWLGIEPSQASMRAAAERALVAGGRW